jgi:hypothetical protein
VAEAAVDTRRNRHNSLSPRMSMPLRPHRAVISSPIEKADAGLRVCVEDMSAAQLLRASMAGLGARTPYPTPRGDGARDGAPCRGREASGHHGGCHVVGPIRRQRRPVEAVRAPRVADDVGPERLVSEPARDRPRCLRRQLRRDPSVCHGHLKRTRPQHNQNPVPATPRTPQTPLEISAVVGDPITDPC